MQNIKESIRPVGNKDLFKGESVSKPTRQQRRAEIRRLAKQIRSMKKRGMLPSPKKNVIQKVKDLFKGEHGNLL